MLATYPDFGDRYTLFAAATLGSRASPERPSGRGRFTGWTPCRQMPALWTECVPESRVERPVRNATVSS